MSKAELAVAEYLKEEQEEKDAIVLETVAEGGTIEDGVKNFYSKRGGARPGAGRPKKIEGRRSANKPVTVYLTNEEFEAFDRLVESTGKSKTALIREFIFNETKKLD